MYHWFYQQASLEGPVFTHALNLRVHIYNSADSSYAAPPFHSPSTALSCGYRVISRVWPRVTEYSTEAERWAQDPNWWGCDLNPIPAQTRTRSGAQVPAAHSTCAEVTSSVCGNAHWAHVIHTSIHLTKWNKHEIILQHPLCCSGCFRCSYLHFRNVKLNNS